MSDIAPIRQRIVINQTFGQGGKDLLQCYFLPTAVEGVYNLYDKQSNILAANVVSGQNFNFTVDKVHYHISEFSINNALATGTWKNNRPVPADEQEGTFQAQAGGGLPTEVEVNAPVAVADPPAGAIEIDRVTGGSDKDKLKKCYFLPAATAGQYDFYSKDGDELATGLTSGTDFDFTYDSIDWTVTSFVISNTAASGNWSNPDNITAEQDGTFQAQAGGGAGEDSSASAASA